MVGPSITDEDRRTLNRRLKIGIVLLVGLSGGLVALQVEPTLPQIAGAIASGLIVGALLVAFLTRTARQMQRRY